MAKFLSNTWKVGEKSILAIWDAKGKSSSSFGTGIHKYRELYEQGKDVGPAVQLVIKSIRNTQSRYEKLKEAGAKITLNSKSATDNYAKPSHKDIHALMYKSDKEIETYIEKINSDFIKLESRLGFDKYKSLQEVYVTYSKYGMGGEVDKLLVLDWEKKICRVQDYKIKDKEMDKGSSNNQLLHELAKKNASENDIIKIQLSYYAFCLTMAGWTVLGGDVYSRNGEWKHYKLDLIPTGKMRELLIKYL